METRSGGSQEVLIRIQEETKRVKRRLTADSGPKERQEEQFNNNHHPSFEVTAPNGTVEEVSPNHRELPIEASTGSYFEDPVPANQMSNHLKNEHEAFKARCVVFLEFSGAVSAF
jgi:hypothetical protein